MAKGLYDAYSALKSGLQGINGAAGGYWLTFGSSNVFPTLTTPNEDTMLPEYYLCIPLADEPFRSEEQDQRSLKRFWTQTIFGFVRDEKNDPSDTTAIERVLKMHDDLDKYFLDNPTLGGVVKDVQLASGFHSAGAVQDEPYGELVYPIMIEQFIDSSDIGSAA